MLPNSVHSVQIKLGNVNRLHKIGIMELVSASEAARIMDIPQTTLSRWIIGGRVSGAIKVANMWLVPADITLEDIERPRMGRPKKKETSVSPQ